MSSFISNKEGFTRLWIHSFSNPLVIELHVTYTHISVSISRWHIIKTWCRLPESNWLSVILSTGSLASPNALPWARDAPVYVKTSRKFLRVNFSVLRNFFGRNMETSLLVCPLQGDFWFVKLCKITANKNILRSILLSPPTCEGLIYDFWIHVQYSAASRVLNFNFQLNISCGRRQSKATANTWTAATPRIPLNIKWYTSPKKPRIISWVPSWKVEITEISLRTALSWSWEL